MPYIEGEDYYIEPGYFGPEGYVEIKVILFDVEPEDRTIVVLDEDREIEVDGP